MLCLDIGLIYRQRGTTTKLPVLICADMCSQLEPLDVFDAFDASSFKDVPFGGNDGDP